MFSNYIDPRVKSSLSEEEIIFPPYNALQIQDILRKRSELAFKPNAIEEGVIPKCSAFAAREHGDARRALEKGAKTLSDSVRITLGPKGRNVVLDKKFGSPTITKDGVTVAKEIELQDFIIRINHESRS